MIIFLFILIASLVGAGVYFDRKWRRERIVASARSKWEAFHETRSVAEAYHAAEACHAARRAGMSDVSGHPSSEVSPGGAGESSRSHKEVTKKS